MSLQGERLTVTDAVTCILRSHAVVQATVTSSEAIEWSQEAWTKRGIFMPCTRRHITVRKTSSDGEWVSGATGDYLGMRVPSVVTGQMLCDVVAVVDLRLCERRVMEHLDGITAALTEHLPWELARRVCAMSLV